MRYGLRILGSTREPRRLVGHSQAWAAYASCDPQAQVDHEAYFSAFQFGDEMPQHIDSTGSTKGYVGPCGADIIYWDIDRDCLAVALTDARRLAVEINNTYGQPLVFFSGGKGFHTALQTYWRPEPSPLFHRVTRQFCTSLAERAGVPIDTGVYDRVRILRAPNSRHPKSGLYKRWLSLDELLSLEIDQIIDLARSPKPFSVTPIVGSERAKVDWQAAIEAVEQQERAQATRKPGARLNALTLDFIRNGATTGDRHRLLFSAAANLSEFGCPPELAHALLTDAGLDCGLPPCDVVRQIDCGLSHRSAT